MLNRNRLWIALFVAYGRSYAIAALLKIVQDCLAFLQPQLLRLLLAYISSFQGTHNHKSSILEGFAIGINSSGTDSTRY